MAKRKTDCVAAAEPVKMSATGPVRDDEVFTIQDRCDRVGTTRQQVYVWEKQGMAIRKRGGRIRVTGLDYNEFWRTAPLRKPANDAGAEEAQ